MSENKLSHLKPLIQSGAVTVFGELFLHASLEDVAEAMGCGPDQVMAIRRDHGNMRLGQLWGLSDSIGLPWRRVMDLFVE
jgi:hypothetical protein